MGLDIKSDSRVYSKNINWIFKEGKVKISELYIGKVVDNKDDNKQGCIKVFIPEFMDNSDVKYIIARPIYQDRSQHIVPKIDDLVLVAFIHGNLQEAVYLGSVRLIGNTDENLNAKNDKIENENDYWLLESRDRKFRIRYNEDKKVYEVGYVDDKIYISIDADKKTITIETSDKSSIVIDQDQKITLTKGQSTIEMQDNIIDIKMTQNEIKIDSNGVTITNGSGTIKLDPSGITMNAPIIKLN